MNSPSSATAEKTCVICYDTINSQPICEEENERILDCSHIFHRECIGEWLKQKHNCPVCRAHVDVGNPEAPRQEMTLEEILAVPDNLLSNAEILSLIRSNIQEVRRVRRLDLIENTPVSQTAAIVNSLAMRFFGFQ